MSVEDTADGEDRPVRPSDGEVEQRRQARTGRRVERARNAPIPDHAPEGAKETP